MIKIDQNQYLYIKRLLSKACHAKREMDKYTELIENAVSIAEKVTPSYSMAPGGGNANSDKMANYVADIDELYARAQEATKKYLKAIKDVDDLINKLNNELYIAVLRRRYLGGERWEAIAFELGYAMRHVQRVHQKAIEKLARL